MRVVITNMNAAVAHALALMLEQKAGYEIVAEASRAEQIVPAVRDGSAEMLLVDPEIPGLDLDNLVDEATKYVPSLIVVVMTSSGDSVYLRQAVEAGARAYVSMDAEPDELIRTLGLIAEGHVIASGPAANDLSDLFQDSDNGEAPDLSDREIEVVNLIVRGASNREIAGSLVIAESTVKVHLRNIYAKLDLRNRQQLASHALVSGLVQASHVG